MENRQPSLLSLWNIRDTMQDFEKSAELFGYTQEQIDAFLDSPAWPEEDEEEDE